MFKRHHHETALEFSIVAPRRAAVRLLETDEDLRAAVERASAFERARENRSGHALSYERYLDASAAGLVDVFRFDPSEAASA